MGHTTLLYSLRASFDMWFVVNERWMTSKLSVKVGLQNMKSQSHINNN